MGTRIRSTTVGLTATHPVVLLYGSPAGYPIGQLQTGKPSPSEHVACGPQGMELQLESSER